MKRSTRRKWHWAATLTLGCLLPGWGPYLGERHARKFPRG